jgi:D-alanine-D-alanine ligase
MSYLEERLLETEFIIVDNEPFMLEMNTVRSDVRKSTSATIFSGRISLEDLFTNAIELALV